MPYSGLQERLSDILTSDDYTVATNTMLIPKFKVNHLQPTHRATVKDLLIRAVQSATAEQESSPPASSSLCDPADDSLFSFMSQTAADSYVSTRTRMWANAQPDGRPAKHRWRPLFNAAKFG